MLQPLSNRILIEKNAEEDQVVHESGLVVVGGNKKSSGVIDGIVSAVGEGILDKNGKIIPMSVKVGDKILFPEYSAEEVDVDGKKYLMIQEDQVLGIIK